MNPELAAVIVNYNAGPELRTALRSIAEEMSGRTWEAVVVDNASTDGSSDIVSEFGAVVARGPRDPVVRRLKKVSCAGGTQIRVIMYAWVGDRGAFIARHMADLRRKGCDIKVILSQPSKDVKRILSGAGIPIRSADMDLDNNESTGFGETRWERFTHEKWMTLNGTWNGHQQKVVWTGSDNWSGLSFLNDEVTLKIPRASVWAQYNAHFDFEWNNRTRAY